MTITDMSMAATMDMTKTCASILGCATTCIQGTGTDLFGCVQTCAMGATGTAQTNFGALEQCILSNCALDAGVAELKGCVGTAIAGPCKTQVATCSTS